MWSVRVALWMWLFTSLRPLHRWKLFFWVSEERNMLGARFQHFCCCCGFLQLLAQSSDPEDWHSGLEQSSGPAVTRRICGSAAAAAAAGCGCAWLWLAVAGRGWLRLTVFVCCCGCLVWAWAWKLAWPLVLQLPLLLVLTLGIALVFLVGLDPQGWASAVPWVVPPACGFSGARAVLELRVGLWEVEVG